MQVPVDTVLDGQCVGVHIILYHQSIQLALAVGIMWEFLLRLQNESRVVHYGHENDRCDAGRPNGI